MKDPFTEEPVSVTEYRSRAEEVAALYGGRLDGGEGAFKYAEAPERGWQEGKKDFSDKATYQRWHNFKKEDGYGLQT